MRLLGWRWRDISLATGLSLGSIHSVFVAFKKNGTIEKKLNKGRKPLLMPPEVEQHLLHGLYEDRFLSLK